jgi:hypothetical protein
MEKINCVVRLGGDLNHTVAKQGVTPAEYAILRAIHVGNNPAIANVEPVYTGAEDRTPHAQERERLVSQYGSKWVEKLFPSGVNPTLPVHFKDVGVTVDFSKVEPLQEIPVKSNKKKQEPELAEA